MQQPFAFPTGLRGAGAATRTAQTIGLEWLDYAKQSADAMTATMQRLAAARTPAETVAIQVAFLRESGERFTARAAVFGDLLVRLGADLAGPTGGARLRPAA